MIDAEAERAREVAVAVPQAENKVQLGANQPGCVPGLHKSPPVAASVSEARRACNATRCTRPARRGVRTRDGRDRYLDGVW